MDPSNAHQTPAPSDEIGRDILDRALADGGAINLADASAIHRAIGWPPPRLDDDGAIRAPTPAELARWESADPAIVDGLEWAELGAEIEHRAPSAYRATLAAQRATVLALRVRDCKATGAQPTDDEPADDGAPITADEIAEWDRVGRVLASRPQSLRRILGALSGIDLDGEANE